jgi:GntR family transcriptional regulator, sialic acid-inducible nan operon repressor
MAADIPFRRRMYHDVAEGLSRQINSGELADGSLLPSERSLAQTYGVSRTSIREALLSLQASGLVLGRPRTRARVTHMGNTSFFRQLSDAAKTLLARPDGMGDFQEARVLFECGLARHAARHASPKEIDRLATALAVNKRAIGNTGAFERTDVAFHDVIADIHRNQVLSALNSALFEWLTAQRKVSISGAFRGAMKTAYLGHAAVFEAISARDAEAADRAMASHLDEVSRYYWRAIATKAR